MTCDTIRIASAQARAARIKTMLQEARHQMLTLMRAAVTLLGAALILGAVWALVLATSALRIGRP